MKKNPFQVAAMDSSHAILLFFHFIIFINPTFTSSSAPTISYTNHCAYMVPEATPTSDVHMYTVYPFLEPQTSYYRGGERILGKNTSFGGPKSLYFAATNNIFMTNVDDLFKIEARLIFQTHSFYHVLSNTTSGRQSSNHTRNKRRTGSIDFLMNGYWSVSSKKLCMVGSAPWFSIEGKPINLEAVLKLNFSRKLTVLNSLISGVLESLASSRSDPSYFEPISILGFPRVTPHKYNYTLVSEQGCSEGNILPNSSLRLNESSICSVFSWQFNVFKLKYPSECDSVNPSLNCTTFGVGLGSLPSFLSLYAIQCSQSERKLRYLVGFPKNGYAGYDSSFDPSTALIGEGVWDVKRNQLCLVLCRILNQDVILSNAYLGDCSIRLTLRYRAVWSIRNRIRVEGEIWTNKTANDVGYFDKVKFENMNNGMVNLPGLKYEYTEMEKVQKSCPPLKTKILEKKGRTYPNRHSRDMMLDIKANSKNFLAWGFADPVSLGSQLYDVNTGVTEESRSGYVTAATHSSGGLMNISYRISLHPNILMKLGTGISLLNSSLSQFGQVEIASEGVYDDRTGHLCMVGCRRLIPNESFDCEMLVKIDFPSENSINEGKRSIKGSIESLRNKNDLLYFDRLDISSYTVTSSEARRNIWRMDLEIILVVISNTLTCVFVGLQLLHVKKQPQVLPFISPTMLLILALSHMIPLLLNFEALYTGHYARQSAMVGSGGWLEVNEVFVRIVTMVAFILEFRLLQLAWTAKPSGRNEKGAWLTEIKTLFLVLPMYILGGSIALLGNRFNSTELLSQSVWENLRSYAGLVLDGFLFPQILLNAIESSKGITLSSPFYVGTTLVRLLPHAYDLYRGQSYIVHKFNWLYIYANPRGDFYSPCWDIVIASCGVVFVGIIALQQQFGGRFFLPQKFKVSEEYEMVSVSTSS